MYLASVGLRGHEGQGLVIIIEKLKYMRKIGVQSSKILIYVPRIFSNQSSIPRSSKSLSETQTQIHP